MKTKEKVEQGKGTTDHLMPLGYLFGFYGWLVNLTALLPLPAPHDLCSREYGFALC